METILIVVLIVLLLGGGGWYGRAAGMAEARYRSFIVAGRPR